LATVAISALVTHPSERNIYNQLPELRWQYERMKEYQAGILADYVPYTPLTAQNLKKLAVLKPKTLAIMHGSSFTGDCARALDDLEVAFREVFGGERRGDV